MSRKVDLAYILAYDAEMPMRKLLSEKYDKHASSFDDLEQKINQVILQHGDDGLKDLAMYHPDRDLILATYTPPVIEAKKVEEVKSNCCGMTSGFDSEKTSNCAGSTTCPCNKGKSSYEGTSNAIGITKDDSLNILAILGIVAVVGIILKK